MKAFILNSIFLLFFTLPISAQEENPLALSAQLADGYPDFTEFFFKANDVTQPKHADLETGIDSIQFTFATFQMNEVVGFIYVIKHGLKSVASTGSFSNKTPSSYNEKIEIAFDNSRYKTELQVEYEPGSDIIHYQWLNNGVKSKTAVIRKVEKPIDLNKVMPLFSANTLDGKLVSLSDFKGKYLVLNWWATSCGPCVAEMPGLNKMVEKYKSRNDVAFLAIADNNAEELEKFFKKRDFQYQQSYNKDLTPLFGKSYPKHIIINPEGIVTYYLEGGSHDIYLNIENSLSMQLQKR